MFNQSVSDESFDQLLMSSAVSGVQNTFVMHFFFFFFFRESRKLETATSLKVCKVKWKAYGRNWRSPRKRRPGRRPTWSDSCKSCRWDRRNKTPKKNRSETCKSESFSWSCKVRRVEIFKYNFQGDRIYFSYTFSNHQRTKKKKKNADFRKTILPSFICLLDILNSIAFKMNKLLLNGYCEL